eukprot:98201_1
MSAAYVSVNDKVYVKTLRSNGKVKFAGNITINNKNAYWYGVELDDPLGDCDGSINGEVYFYCYDYYGTFCEIKDIQLIQKAPIHNTYGVNTALIKIHQSTTSLQSVTSDNDKESQSNTTQSSNNYQKQIAPKRKLPSAPNKSLPPIPNSNNNKTIMNTNFKSVPNKTFKAKNVNENNKHVKAQTSIQPHTDFEKMNFIQLKKECDRLGIPANGTKLRLLERLRKYIANETNNIAKMTTEQNNTRNNVEEPKHIVSNSNSYENNNNSVCEVSNIDTMNKVQLMRECNINGISMFGSEELLRQRLKEKLHLNSSKPENHEIGVIPTNSRHLFTAPKLKTVASGKIKDALWQTDSHSNNNNNAMSFESNMYVNSHIGREVGAWKNKHINDWNNNELIDWIKTINIGTNVSRKIIQDISVQQICGLDFNSLKSPIDISNSFTGMSKRIANKIYEELVKIRKLN